MAEMRLAKIRKYGIGKHWDPKAVEELIDELRPAVVRRYRGAVEAIWAGSDIQAAKDAAFVEPTKQKERITANLAAMKIAAAMRAYMTNYPDRIEGSAGLALAALDRVDLTGPVVVVICGRNSADATLATIGLSG